MAERGVFLRRDSVETLVVECSVIKCATALFCRLKEECNNVDTSATALASFFKCLAAVES